MNNFPSSLDTYVTRVAGDAIVEHHINNLQDAVEALEVKMGVDSSAVTTSHDYKLRYLPAQDENWDVGSYEVRAETFESDVATGTAPFIVASTTKVTNLNTHYINNWAWVSGDTHFSTTTTAPTGWTDVSATYNNKFVRINSGTPLGTGGADTDSITLAITNLPSHVHSITATTTHLHTYTGDWQHHFYPGEKVIALEGGGDNTSASGAHTHGGVTGSVGSGTSFTVDTVPAYIQLRIFKKD